MFALLYKGLKMLEAKRKVLFYYHHFGGLGHGTRILAICKAIKEIGHCDILVINSGKKQPELVIEQYAWVINLPSFEAEHGLFAGLKADEGIGIRFRKRSVILNKVQESFKPDVAVFEHFPFGRASLAGEICYFIGLLRNDGCRVYSSVRDIIEQSVDAAAFRGHLKLFDGVLVHSEKDMGLITNFKQPEGLKNKLFFTGRVVSHQREDLGNKQKIRRQFNVTSRKWIVISVGGGIDGEKIIERLIAIKKLLDKKVPNSFLISTGPNISPAKYKELKRKVSGRGDIVMTLFDPDLLQYVNAADLSVSMGGYNSVNNALLTGTKTLVFPRSTDKEQKKRAHYFSEYVDLADESFSDDRLVKAILACMDKPKAVYPLEMQGALRTARLLDFACSIKCLKIRVNSECNLACDMCSWKKQAKALPEEVLRNLILRAKIAGVRGINLTGGEPTLLPKLKDILKFIKDQGCVVSLSTNGYVKPERLKEIVPLLDRVDISLDSFDATVHDRIRGKAGAFKETMGTIKLLAAAGIKPHINVTIRPDNYKGLHQMITLLGRDIDSISFNLVDTGMLKGKAAKFIFSAKQLESFYSDEWPLISKEGIKNRIKVKITPTTFRPRLNKCTIPQNYLRVNPDGDIAFCCFQDDEKNSWGNVIREDLCDIVVSDGFFNFIHNAVESKGPCRSCKQSYNVNYGGNK